MTALTYTILTDPATLEASAAWRKATSKGTVYLVVTNPGRAVDWSQIEVNVPLGNDAGDLTPDSTINVRGEYVDPVTGREEVNIQWQGNGSFRITPQVGFTARFDLAGHMVLTLEDFTVAAMAGVAVLTVTEITRDKRGGRINLTAVPLVV
ncbi:hypothetical protein [Nonomuraea sediminis]|uniref:hypothetical protein n=1 Tax=Nonomuraea sediminis TaxID=2835864 RepID=UPI001BDD79BA|nr:hypothetical protein [Nonomuraea sediminis]